MTHVFDLGGRASLMLTDHDNQLLTRVRAEMDPFEAVETQHPVADVVLERDNSGLRPRFQDWQNPAADGVITAVDERDQYVLFRGRWCRLPSAAEESHLRFTYQRGFSLHHIFSSAVRPALQISMLRRGVVAAHSASVERKGKAVVIAGWSESGKTETALALAERGARFLSDKWSVIGPDSTVTAFPISVGIRRWVLPYLPTLKSALPPPARAQFTAAALASTASRPVRALNPSGRMGTLVLEAIEHAVTLGDRAALRPSQVAAAFGHPPLTGASVPLGAVALLSTVPTGDVRVEPAPARWAARRLARSASYERGTFYRLYERRLFAFPEQVRELPASIETQEEDMLTERIDAIPVLNIRAPFPSDPHRAADAIESYLSR